MEVSKTMVKLYSSLINTISVIGLIQLKEEGCTGFSEGWQGCSEGFPEHIQSIPSIPDLMCIFQSPHSQSWLHGQTTHRQPDWQVGAEASLACFMSLFAQSSKSFSTAKINYSFSVTNQRISQLSTCTLLCLFINVLNFFFSFILGSHKAPNIAVLPLFTQQKRACKGCNKVSRRFNWLKALMQWFDGKKKFNKGLNRL